MAPSRYKVPGRGWTPARLRLRNPNPIRCIHVDEPLPPAEPVPDAVLLARFARGNDMDAASELIARHEADLLRVAHALLGNAQAAQDAAQEAFLALCRERDRLAANAKGHRGLGGWLCTVVRNHCLDQLRARAYRRHLDAAAVDPAGAPDDPAHPIDARDGAARIWGEVSALPPLERAAVVLRYRDGLSYQDIAERLGKTATHVGVLLHTALGRLRSAGRLACLAPGGAA